MYNELEHSHMDDQIEMVESLTQTEDLDRMDHDSDLGHEQEESSSLTVV